MFMRCYFLIQALLSYSVYKDSYASELCKAYGFNPSFFFNIKSQMVVFPEKTILYFFTVTMLLTAYIIRIFENPNEDSGFTSFFTSLWWTVITMTTIGYGDISPVTPPG